MNKTVNLTLTWQALINVLAAVGIVFLQKYQPALAAALGLDTAMSVGLIAGVNGILHGNPGITSPPSGSST